MTTPSTIAIPQPELPNPLPADHQLLMNIFYSHWQDLADKVRQHNQALTAENRENMLREPTQGEIAAVMPGKVNAAVILGNHNYQVENGGWSQWDFNGYSESVGALRMLYCGAAAIGIEDADKVLDLIDQFVSRKSDNRKAWAYSYDYDDEDDCGDGDSYNDLDTAFYAIDREKLMQAILDRFDEVVSSGFMAGAYRKAA